MKEIIWILSPENERGDLSKIVEKISNNQDINLSNYKVSQLQGNTIIPHFKDEIIHYLLEEGFSSLFNLELILEHIIPKNTATNDVLKIIKIYLDKIDIDDELIIIDQFFFAKNQNAIDYEDFIEQIFDNYIQKINNLIIITNSNFDQVLKDSIIAKLKSKKATLSVHHKQWNDFHDRFWISGKRQKGMVMGTSLNGIGKKLALLDILKTDDVLSIINELKNSNLI